MSQTNNHDVILISTFCLQICNWQRQSSVSTVNRALLSTLNDTYNVTDRFFAIFSK